MVFVLCILVSIRRGKIVVCPELLFADKIKSSRCLTPETCTKPDPTFRQTGNGPWSAHITKWHKPTPPPVAEKKRKETRAAVLGTKGLGLKSFFKKASPAPSKASAPPSQAKDGGAPILPPPPPLLARRTSVALPPPLASFIQPTPDDPFHVRLQRLILSHFASEAPGPLYICPGYLLELPNPAVLNYPYELSNALGRVKQPGVACDISWSVPDDDGRVRSKSCLVKTPADDEPCEKCGLLKGSTLLAAVLRRAWDTTVHLGMAHDGFLGNSQQSLRLKHRRGLYQNLSAGLLSKLLVADDGPCPLVRGARDAGCPSQSRAQQGSRRTALLSSLLASPQLCSLQGNFQTPGKGAGSLSRALVAELSPAGFRRAAQRSPLTVPPHPPGHNRPPHRPPSSLFAFRVVFWRPLRCPAAQRNKAGPRALD